jgi:uncharacterized membrane protein
VFSEYGLMFFVAGSFMGLTIDAKKYRGTVRGVNDTNILKTGLRIALSAIVIVPIYVCPVFLIQSRRYILPIMLIKYVIPSFMAGVLLYGYSKTIY